MKYPVCLVIVDLPRRYVEMLLSTGNTQRILQDNKFDQIKEKEASNKCMRHVYKCDSTYLSPSSLKKSPPPRSSPPRSRKRKRGGNAGRSPPISRDVASVLSEIILRCEFPPVFHQQCRYPVFPSHSSAKSKGFLSKKALRRLDIHSFSRTKKTSNITTGQPLAGRRSSARARGVYPSVLMLLARPVYNIVVV